MLFAFLSAFLVAGAAAGPPEPTAKSSVRLPVAARSRQELVVTNQNLAVATETRRAGLPAGRVTLVWEGLPPSVRTETWSIVNAREAGLRWLGLTSAPAEGAESDARAWLSSLVGKKVRIERTGGTTEEGEVVAVFGPTPDLVLFREGSELVYGEPDARISLDAAAAARPASGVSLELTSESSGSRAVTSRYIVADLAWGADYSLALAADEKSGRLDGWFTIENRTGAEFSPDRLRLQAGVLRTQAGPPRPMMAREAMAAQGDVALSVPISESRLYDVPAPAALPPGRTLLPLAVDVGVVVEKTYLVRSSYWMGPNEEAQRVPVAVAYRIGTRPLGRAIPAGTVRVYADSGTVFAGEDRIEHTPEGHDLDVEVSEAFDLVAKRRQTGFQQIGRFESEASFEITISSRKKEAVTVLVRETFLGEWKITASSVEPRRRSASVAEFAVPVAAGGEAKLTYTVRVKVGG